MNVGPDSRQDGVGDEAAGRGLRFEKVQGGQEEYPTPYVRPGQPVQVECPKQRDGQGGGEEEIAP